MGKVRSSTRVTQSCVKDYFPSCLANLVTSRGFGELFNQLKFSLNFPIHQKGDVASNIPSQLMYFSAEEIIVLNVNRFRFCTAK